MHLVGHIVLYSDRLLLKSHQAGKTFLLLLLPSPPPFWGKFSIGSQAVGGRRVGGRKHATLFLKSHQQRAPPAKGSTTHWALPTSRYIVMTFSAFLGHRIDQPPVTGHLKVLFPNVTASVTLMTETCLWALYDISSFLCFSSSTSKNTNLLQRGQRFNLWQSPLETGVGQQADAAMSNVLVKSRSSVCSEESTVPS